MPGNPLVNILLLTAATLIVPRLLPPPCRLCGSTIHNLATGFLAASAVLLVLIAVRRVAPPGTIGTFSPIIWSVIVVLAEEAAKLLATSRLRTAAEPTHRSSPTKHRLSAAALRGWGFAATEHILYAAVSPPAFILRLATAGAIHVGTTVLYTLPRKPHRPSSTTLARRFLLATTVHLLFNITLTSLDALRTFW